MKPYGVTIQMKATEQYFSVVLFTTLSNVFLTFESVDEHLWFDHSNESYWAVFSCDTVYYVVTLKSVDEILLGPYITLLVSVVGVVNLCFKLDVSSESNNPLLAGRGSNGTFPCVRKRKRKRKKKYKWFREHCISKTIYLDISFVLDYCICKNHFSVQSC